MKVPILLQSLSGSTRFVPVISSGNTMLEHVTTRNHVTTILIEKHKRVATIRQNLPKASKIAQRYWPLVSESETSNGIEHVSNTAL